MRKNKFQFSLPGFTQKSKALSHGGSLSIGKRKTARPFDRKQALHVVLRSSKAIGKNSMLTQKNRKHIELLLNRVKKKWNIQVYHFANVGNHIHLLIRARNKRDWQNFIRELTGAIAVIVTNARKGIAGKFWDHLVFTRIVQFGREFTVATDYISKNLWESVGVPVRKYLKDGFKIYEFSRQGFLIVK